MTVLQPVLRFALLCDRGRLRIGNEDAGHCADRMGLFIVSDGMGGLPAGGAASNVIVHALPRFIETAMADLDDDAEDPTVQNAMMQAIMTLSETMYAQSQRCHGLLGWGATVVAVLIRGRKAHILHVGDSRAYLVRKRKLLALTDDHSHVSKILAHGRLVTEAYEQKSRNLVSQHVAMVQSITPTARTIRLAPDDRLLLCSDGLTSPLADKEIGRLLLDNVEPAAACRTLIEQANANGGPDNITALVLDFKGLRTAAAPPAPPELADSDCLDSPITLPREAEQISRLLQRLEKLLAWLHEGATETASSNVSLQAADEAVQRLLGTTVYQRLHEKHPEASPAHLFHQACVGSGGKWRQEYKAVMTALDPLIASLLSGETRLSPLLSTRDAIFIMRTLWSEFRGIERRYFLICQRYAADKRDRPLEILTQHMLESTRTLIGLLQFLPNFVMP